MSLLSCGRPEFTEKEGRERGEKVKRKKKKKKK
jgi:hypothetical protein